MYRSLATIALTLFLVAWTTTHTTPLPSWNDGAARDRILSFVKAATSPADPLFVPIADRIAVFDNDGTLWSEQPAYFQAAFAIDRVAELAPRHPEWQQQPAFKAVLARDLRHAGLCVKRQYAAFAGIANGGEKCNAFFDKLVRRGFAVTADCIHNRARLYHVQHRPLYHAIGEADGRYRRAVPARSAAERLMRLDAALTVPDLD